VHLFSFLLVSGASVKVYFRGVNSACTWQTSAKVGSIQSRICKLDVVGVGPPMDEREAVAWCRAWKAVEDGAGRGMGRRDMFIGEAATNKQSSLTR
jgi:hypothetical protein